MKLRTIGIILIIFSLVMLLSMIPKITTGSQKGTLYDSTKEVPGGIPAPFVYADELLGPTYPEYNVTINPLPPSVPQNTNYIVNILLDVTVWNKTPSEGAAVDLWVVNHTGRNIIRTYLENETYPIQINTTGNFLFPGLKVYAESINKSAVVGPLHGLDYNGNYTIMIINPFRGLEDNVTVVLDDVLTTYMYILEPSEVNIISTGVIALVGLAMVIKKPRKTMPAKRKRGTSLSNKNKRADNTSAHTKQTKQ